jgi:hypothetical protein
MYRVTHEREYDIPKEVGAAETPDGALALVIAYCEEHQYIPTIFLYQKMDWRDAVMVDVGIAEDWFVIVNEDGNLSPEAFHFPEKYALKEHISIDREAMEAFMEARNEY